MTNLGSQTYNISYNLITFLITISAQNNFSLNFNILNNCAILLDFNELNTSQNNTFQTYSIYMTINEFYTDTYCNSFSFIFIILINTNSGSICQYKENSDFKQCVKLSKQPIYNLSINLYNDQKYLINLNNSE